jgi:hypothetical protein
MGSDLSGVLELAEGVPENGAAYAEPIGQCALGG